MKNLISFLLIFTFALSIGSTLQAQDKKSAKREAKEKKKRDKREGKYWKKKAKSYIKSPLTLKNDLESCNKSVADLKRKNKELLNELSDCDSRIDSAMTAARNFERKLKDLQEKYEKLEMKMQEMKVNKERDITPGLVFKVQVGAFVHFDIKKYLKDTGQNFEGETQDGMNKYTMGNFRDKEMAEMFKKDVQKLGIKDAFVVAYRDGIRITEQEAEEFLNKQKSAGG